MDLELRDRVAIVTGGSRGIGKAIARELAREGCNVAVVARGKEALEAAAAEISEETGAAVVAVQADTGHDESVTAMVSAVAERFGQIDILVNNGAAVGSRMAARLPEITQDAFWGEMNVKVMGYLRCMQRVAPYMIERGWGRIINISGNAARTPTSIIGSTRNVAVVALSKNAADELGGHGINVTVVHPGATLTEYYAQQVADVAAQRGISRDDVLRERFASNLIRKAIEPRDIAWVVAFLASPKAIAINGDVIPVAGGTPGPIHY
jgi:NAD(P)-dependent dehydrogenase (short-subunit alcohol dehydrogenase family)